MEEIFEQFKEAILLESGIMEISSALGKPLIKEKLDKMKTKSSVVSGVKANLLFEQINLEIKPQKPFGEIREGMADIGNGMFKKTIVEGFGETLKENTQVTIQYTIFLENKDILIDSSYIAHEPFQFVLGKYLGILPGFERAVRTMRNQEKAEFIVPRLMSAEDGAPLTEDEARDGYLVIEVIKVSDIMTKREKARVLNNINQTLMQTEELREKGRAAFGAGFYRVAFDIYTQAVYMLRVGLAQNQADNKKRLELLMRMYLNIGIVLNKLNQSELALEALRQAVGIMDYEQIKTEDTLKGKILLHQARTMRLQNHPLRAFLSLNRAKKFLGDVKEVKDELKNIIRAYDHILESTYIVGPVAQIFDLSPDVEIYCFKCHDVFHATFDHMVKTFMCSKEQNRVVYGVQDNGHVGIARDVVTKYKKVRLEVQKNRRTIHYILTKK